MTRPSTPNEYHPSGYVKTIHVKRCCNGCGREIGDVTEAEMDAAVAGMVLPDVRDECGCAPKSFGTSNRTGIAADVPIPIVRTGEPVSWEVKVVDPFDAAVNAARKMPHNGKGYGLLEAIRDITKAIEGNLSDEDTQAVVIGAWMGLQVEYDLAVEYSGGEEADEELDSSQEQERLLWEALHYASGAMVEGDPSGIKNAMDVLRLWWEQSRAKGE